MKRPPTAAASLLYDNPLIISESPEHKPMRPGAPAVGPPLPTYALIHHPVERAKGRLGVRLRVIGILKFGVEIAGIEKLQQTLRN